MIAVIQRIAEGCVKVDGEIIAQCEGKGLLVLLGVARGDEEKDAEFILKFVPIEEAIKTNSAFQRYHPNR